MRVLRDWFKRLAFAGLKPQAAGKLPLRERLRRRLSRFMDRLAGTPLASDPLHESNRTWRQNLKATLYVAVPFLIGLSVVLLSTHVVRHRNKPAAVVIPSKLTRDLYDEVLKPSELEIAEIVLEKKTDPPVVHGKARNNSDQKFESAEISFNITDKDGMLLGAVRTTVRNIPPHGSQAFTVAVPQKDAAIVLVRDARRL
jgi:hypothetical protein